MISAGDLIQEITIAEKRRLIYNYRRIELINHVYDSYDSINEAILNIAKSHFDAVLHSKGGDFARMEKLFIDTQNVLLGNFLTAFRMYLDSTDRILSEISSKKLLVTFKRTRNDYYDNSAYYPFCYKLRNHIQHVGYAIESAEIRTAFNKPGQLNVSQIGSYLHKSSLLKRRSSWNKESRSNLRQMEELIDVKIIVNTVSEAVKTFHESIGVGLMKFRKRYLNTIDEFVHSAYDHSSPPRLSIVTGQDHLVFVMSVNTIERLRNHPSTPPLFKFNNFGFAMATFSEVKDTGFDKYVQSISAKK